MLGVRNHVMKGKKQGKTSKKDVKVTYISSPMKVKTSASNFRALVQELTGQDSNVAEMFTEGSYDNNGSAEGVHHHDHHHHKGGSTQQWSEAYLPDAANWLKPDYSCEFDSRSSMEPFNGHALQYDMLSFDML